MTKNNRSFLILIFFVLAMVILYSVFANSLTNIKEINYTELIQEIRNGNVEKVVVTNHYNANAYINASDKKPTYKTHIVSREQFAKDIQNLEKEYPVQLILNDPEQGQKIFNYIWLAVIILGGGFFIFMIMQAQGGGSKMNNFAKSSARMNKNIKVRFSDVAGAEEEKEELAEIVEFLKNPKKFSNLGAKIPRGVLMVGSPGVGKTLFAKAIAGEANVPFFSISGSDFVEMYVGVGASRVRDMFDTAKKHSPCIIFIDEIDAVGRQRGAGMGGGHDEREQTLNQLLVQMDGFETNEGIIVVAATNRADILDPALLRPGRFDRQIYVSLPDVRGREAIFKVHARNKPIDSSINFRNLARITTGFTGADIANVLNEAAIFAARNNRDRIIQKDMNEAINKVIMGPQKRSRVISESDKRITAYHEAGHAIVGKLLEGCDTVQEVTIVPRGNAAGYTMMRPDKDEMHISRSKVIDQITMTLGGRAAEEIIIKDYTAGASGDIKAATDKAKAMVTKWGMSEKVGLINVGGEGEVFLGRNFQEHNEASEALESLVDSEIRSIIDKCHVRAKKILSENKDILENMCRLLIERETIYTDEVNMLIERKPIEEILKYLQEKDLREREV